MTKRLLKGTEEDGTIKEGKRGLKKTGRAGREREGKGKDSK